MAYAIFSTGGKQYRVSEGDKIEIEKIVGNTGDETTFSNVLLVNTGDSTTV
ncbi:MAG: 50S ribosomal protein L21, partial [Verrucomicrobiales bacterium]|nr:50S ribosomal protein L21 [Verrucomicrobiales bacterium]